MVSSTRPKAPAPTVSRISRSEKPHSAWSRAALLRRVLREGAAELLDPLPARRHGHQVGLGEVAVVVRVGLHAAAGGHAGVLVPVPGLLEDRAAAAEDGGVALHLEAHGPLDRSGTS